MGKSRLVSVQFCILFIALFAANYCLYCLNSTVSIYVDNIGGAAKISGVLNTCFTVSACLARLLGGYCVDHFGRKRIIIMGGLCIAAGTVGYSGIVSVPLLMLFRGVQGIGYAIMSVGASTALIDVLPKDRLGEGIGISALASTLAGSIAPSVGLAVIQHLGFKAVFISVAAVALIGMLFVLLFCNYEKKHGRSAHLEEKDDFVNARGLWRVLEKKSLLPAAVNAFFAIGFSITYVFMTLYAVSSGIVNPGSYFIASSVCQILARIIAGKFADRDSVAPVVLLGGFLGGLSYLGLALTANSTVYLISGALFGIGSGLIGPVMNRLAVSDIAPQRRGAASATYLISADIGNGVGGILWGSLIDVVSYSACFLYVTVWMAISLGVAILFLVHRRRRIASAKLDDHGA